MAIIGLNGYISSGKDATGEVIRYLIANQTGRHNPNIEFVPNVQYTESGWKIKKFAGKLKQIASMLTGIPVEKFESQDFKKTKLGKEWNYTLPKHQFEQILGEEKTPMIVRELLQKLGTDAMRKGLHDNVWVNALMADYKSILENSTSREEYEKGKPLNYDKQIFPNWIITDCRFPNEAQAIKDKGGIVIRIDNEKTAGDYPIAVVNSRGQEYSITTEGRHVSETALDCWDFDWVIDNNVQGFNNLIDETDKMLKYFNILG